PFETARIQIPVERRHHEDRVDVRRDDLPIDGASRRRARNRASPLEADLDDAPFAGVPRFERCTADSHPVANGREICRRRRLVTKAAADLNPPGELAGHAIRAALLFDHARERQVVAAKTRSLILEKRAPAQTFQYLSRRSKAKAERHVGSPSKKCEDSRKTGGPTEATGSSELAALNGMRKNHSRVIVSHALK